MQNSKVKDRQITLSIKSETGHQGDPQANIIVRNLPKNVTQDQVREAFNAFGEILSCKVDVYYDGKSKGFAYVQFKNAADAQKAIGAMNGTAKLGSTDLSVSIHIRQADRQTTDIFTNLRVSNLESTTTADDLRKLFESFGEITSTFVPPPKSESDA